MMKKKCRITVLRRCEFPDLIKEYAREGIIPICDVFQDGQEFVLDWDSYSIQGIPSGFCTIAWNSISQFVFSALATGMVIDADWVKNPKEQIVCCPDGLRPVIFKVEAFEE